MATKKPEETAKVLVQGIPSEVNDKLKQIANNEGVTFQEIYNLAFSNFIKTYEAKNGKIKVKPKGSGLQGL